ncbi:iron complex transport system ATP-binding protein [Novosphingobium sp. Rr 2-17]|uniref:ABC transporter ATP-binding protein n=1 Tax=Novosphingobium sp. Rr 2-17 TaxID=555793 RepID=UPI0002699E68|nr:ABC transporter ATP-binding protein [Novosphingobium sp. Rr 2-17]EIZ80827.1 iron complex transport system ATP-binding protein [Novosphingobium sp. Rr 2-17]
MRGEFDSLATLGLSLPGRLGDVTVKLHTGEVTAICGPNGAGKSTLLTCLAGLVAPGSGLVTLADGDLAKLPPKTRAQKIGFLPQTPEIAWDVNVDVLVTLGRLPWGDEGAPSGRAAVDEVIAAMDLEALRHRPVSQLSGGERARALMARVLATQPKWLLADEPLANLDLAHAATLVRRMKTQAREGRGVVLVLHDLATAMNHADRVIVLDRGRVAADSEPFKALAQDVIARVWGCEARWLGDPGQRALAIV